ncbi:MAG: amidohydrolase [Bacillota bacterium]
MLAVVNARLHTMVGPVVRDGVLLADDRGRIVTVADRVEVPEEATIIDARGRDVTPGIIEAHCHAGVHEEGLGWEGSDGNESTDPVTSHVRAIDGANPEDKAFDAFRQAGLTAVQITPGSANIIGGEQFAVKCRRTRVIEEMVLHNPSGMKAALGENPKRVYGPKKGPSTRMGNAAVLRRFLQKASDYRDGKERSNGDGLKYDARLEALIPVIEGELPLRIHCHRADDMATAIRIAEEFDIRYTLEHATQAFKMPEYLKKHDVWCAVGPCLTAEAKVEMRGNGFESAVALWEAGVHFCLTNDHPVVHGRNLRAVAGMLSARGVPDEDALRSVTLWAAEHIGVDHRTGSLQPGRDADLVIWSGDPLDARTFADCTVIDGDVVFVRE